MPCGIMPCLPASTWEDRHVDRRNPGRGNGELRHPGGDRRDLAALQRRRAQREGQPDASRLCRWRQGARDLWRQAGRLALQEFCDLIDKGGPVPELEARVVTIDYAGNAGMARLEARNWRGTRYTDFFVLIKRDGAWRISDKVFFAHSRA